uniref:Uncharacterized protein n=1 Tax=Aplanochytrium stocchinoi TaxID=215587 RepID=A0A7S3LQ92_9STRA
MKRRRIHTKDAYGRGKFSVSEVFAAFKDFPKVKEKEGAIKDLKLQWEFKLQLRFKSENSLYEALTHYKLANAFNREVNLRESEIWRRNDELRWFGQMMVDACMLRNLQRIFRRASGRLLEEEKNRTFDSVL